jgi:hypothetical protein
VAGWGPSGQSARPGFGWFFGGDAAINSLAMSSAGLHAPVAEGLRFFAKYQRADGKITHEISQAAARVPWLTDFPYPYYHADTTPYWIVSAWQHWRATGDRATIDELWPAIVKAWQWCLTTETDGDGLIENTTGGYGAIEVGAIGDRIHQDIYLAAVWVMATRAMAELADARGEQPLAEQASTIGEKARRSLDERYWLEGVGRHAFGILSSGETNDALTVWPATAAAFGLLDEARARRTLAALASNRLTTDWGSRMLATDHPLYDPLHYNMGAVWPFVTGFVALGHFQYGRPWAGFPLVDALARLTFDFARGRHAELLSGAYYRPLDTAVPHQFFATSMLVTPLVQGLVGWAADAPRARARLAPQIPPSWPTLAVRGLPAGDTRLEARWTRRPGSLAVTLQASGPALTLDYVPPAPPGASNLRTTGAPAPPAGGARPARIEPLVVRVGSEPVTLTTTWTGGYEVEAPQPARRIGETSAGPRVLDVAADGAAVRVELEGRLDTSAVIVIHGPRPAKIDGGEVHRWSDARGEVRVRFEAAADAPAGYGRRTLVLQP